MRGMGAQGAQVDDVVVVGASVAGLLVAAALARDGRSVTLLERDDLPDGPTPRPGVPQGRQPDVLLLRGLRAIDELLPGFADDLRHAGAVRVDTGYLAWLSPLGWSPQSPQLEVLLATRPLIEHLLRARVLALPGVRAVGGRRVTGLRRGDPGEPRWWVGTTPAGWSDDPPTDADPGVGEDAWPADVVVDASGRASRLPAWLAALGVPAAGVEEVDAQVGYATVRVRLPVDRVSAHGVVVLGGPGQRGGTALPAEGGAWTVSGIGAGEVRPPRDLASLRDYLAGVRDDALLRVLEAGEVEGDVATYRQTGNRRHRYDRVAGWPDGLLVVGDALCAFDPVYGQGMTVAALEALALRAADDDLAAPGGARRAVRACARLAETPWQMAAGADRTLAGLPEPRDPVSRLAGWWVDQVQRMSVHGDLDAQDALQRTYHLVAPPTSLFHPRLLARWVRARVRGPGPRVPRPAVLPDDVTEAAER